MSIEQPQAPQLPAQPPQSTTCSHWRAELAKYDWSVEIASAVMLSESSCDPTKHNGNSATGDDSWGLFQINLYGSLAAGRPSAEWLTIGENNISYAYQMYKRSGWSPWSAYTSGAYIKHL